MAAFWPAHTDGVNVRGLMRCAMWQGGYVRLDRFFRQTAFSGASH